MTIGERIRMLRTEQRMTQEELARRLGYAHKTSVNKIETGAADLPRRKVEEAARIFSVSPLFLLGLSQNRSEEAASAARTRRVPLVGTIACGTPVLAEENIEGWFDILDETRADFCLRCRGDSMTGARIHDGDVVFIRRCDDVEDGRIAAVLIGDEATLKRVYKTGNGLVLQPENPAYKPIFCTGEDVRLLGVAVAFLSAVR